MVTISVAMATFNGAKFIPQQLDSIAKQSVQPAELVITDDGSTDATLEIAEQFSRSVSFPVRISRNDSRLGYRANFMSNFARCQSDVIAVCDQDDIWDSRKLEIAGTAFRDPDVIMFCHDAWLVDAEGARLGEANIIKLPPINPPLSFYPLINPLGFAIVFRRALVDFADDWHRSVDTWESGNRMAHDQWLCFLASVFGTIAFSDEKLTNYRQHAQNTYGWRSPGLWARYKSRLQNPGRTYEAHARASLARASVLEGTKVEMSPGWEQRGREAATMYRRFGRRLSNRARLYLASSFPQRVAAVRALYQDGAYTGATSWDLSRKTLAKDVLFGIALRGLLSEPFADAKESVLRSDPKPGL